MTVRLVYIALLTELSKVQSPSMLLADFNYFLNKAIQLFINRRYLLYDMNLQMSDDLRVLLSQANLMPLAPEKLSTASYVVILPLDYMHLLNCICIYKTTSSTGACASEDDTVSYSAKRLTADSKPMVLSDYYSRPKPSRPYFYIHQVNTSNDLPTNPISSNTELNRSVTGTDSANDYGVHVDGDEVTVDSNLPRTVAIDKFLNKSLVDKEAGVRYGNSTNIRMEIHCGKDAAYELKSVIIDYVKTPLYVNLTLQLLNVILDTSQIMEFPDVACYEIINELTYLVMDNNSDSRLNTHAVVTSTVASPAQQRTPSALNPAPKYYTTNAAASTSNT